MKWVLIIAGVIVCLIIIVVLIGMSLPVKHSASIATNIDEPVDSVWQKLTNVKDYPKWRKNLKKVEVISANEWVETDNKGNTIPFKITEAIPNTKLVSTINWTDRAFGGNWTFLLEPDGKGTIITITENGEVYNPFFRFVSRYIIGYTTSLKQFADYLKKPTEE